ncbi:hypothetical protein LPB86_15760 [Pedobacter sp. MC2016-14]|uniref:hypothetical protein n=1 Tax=Pedobacter sp. MC2016-14 TaxID=2897327 RepID=UPI001E4364ED|nr:hypothetical protein [Pedobacter sp. MC2016-14]MCD0489698.1 hypothetical protein [Pedobacter sp. MC2016-14]
MNIIYDITYKTELIIKHLIPALGCLSEIEGIKLQDIITRCRLHHVRKYDTLESPGSRNEGFLWFPINAMSHHYFYDRKKSSKIGTRIWNKRDFIFEDASLLDGKDRRDTLEILEEDEVISISYDDLDHLMRKYIDINTAVEKLSARNNAYFRRKSFLMNLSSFERVRQFREENNLFTFCATQDIQAMHVNLTRRMYFNLLNKLKGTAPEYQ